MDNQPFSDKNILQFLLEYNNLTVEDVLKIKDDMERKEIIEQHNNNFSIWQGKNNRWYTYLHGDTGDRKLIAKSTLDNLEKTIVKHYREQKANPAVEEITLRTLYPIWFNEKWLETNNSNYMKHIDLEWRNHYLKDAIIDIPVINFTKQQLKTWAREKIIDNRMTKKQYYNMQVIIRQSLDYLVSIDKLSENPFRGFTINKNLFCPEQKKEHEEEVFSIEEEKAIKDLALDDFYNRSHRTACLLVVLNFSLGLRVGEIVALKWKDLKAPYLMIRRMEQRQYEISADNEWELQVTVVDHTKTENGYRKLYVVESALEIFDMIRESNIKNGYDCSPESYIFQHDNKRVQIHSIDWYYQKYCRKLNIVKKGNHKVRKTCLTKIADNPNINIKDAMEFAGHADVKTFVKHYCFSRYSDEHKRIELERSLSQ